jgi:DNA-directed RNA polymerase specialized sigma24 family protein
MESLKELGDDDLLRRFRAGDQAAFTAMYDRYAPRLAAHATRLVGLRHDGEDAVRDAFIHAHAVLLEDDREVRLGPWLHRAVHDRAIDLLRARQAGPCLARARSRP